MNPDDIAPSATIMAFAIVVPGVFIACGAKHDEHKTKICVHRPNSRLAHQLSRTSRGRASVPGSHGSAVLAEVPGHLGVPRFDNETCLRLGRIVPGRNPRRTAHIKIAVRYHCDMAMLSI